MRAIYNQLCGILAVAGLRTDAGFLLPNRKVKSLLAVIR